MGQNRHMLGEDAATGSWATGSAAKDSWPIGPITLEIRFSRQKNL